MLPETVALAERVQKLSQQLNPILNHPIFVKMAQGGPLAIPQGGFLNEGRHMIGGNPLDGQVYTWDSALQQYGPEDVPAGGAPHGLLSASHNDTLAAGVSRGSIIVGNSTPEWSELVLGASGTFPRSDGTDLAFSTIQGGDVPATHSGSAHHGQSHTLASHSARAHADLSDAPAAAHQALVTLAGTPDYITISGQVITRGLVDLAADVTGDLPIAEGGTGQSTKTPAFDALAPTTTKGDVIGHNGSDNIRLAIGTNDQVLTAASGEAIGFKWADAAGGGGGDEIVDADGDTKVQTEEGADDDTIRFDTLGSERVTISASGVINFTNTSRQFTITPALATLGGNNYTGIDFIPTQTRPTGSTRTMRAFNAQMTVDADGGTSGHLITGMRFVGGLGNGVLVNGETVTAAEVVGIYVAPAMVVVNFSGTETVDVTEMWGIRVEPSFTFITEPSSAGIVATYYGVDIQDDINSQEEHVTDWISLRIQDITLPTGTIIGIQQLGLTMENRFESNFSMFGKNAQAAATVDVVQDAAAGAKSPLRLQQDDVSEEMMEFETTIGTGNAIEAVGAKTLTTTHFIKVTLPGGLTRYIPAGTIA